MGRRGGRARGRRCALQSLGWMTTKPAPGYPTLAPHLHSGGRKARRQAQQRGAADAFLHSQRAGQGVVMGHKRHLREAR